MTDERGKGFMGGSMKFGVSDDASEPGERAPLLPLRVAVIADLVPTGEHNAGASAPDAAIRVTLDRFDDLFAKLRPRIAIQVPSVLAEGRPVRVDLAPTSMKSFRPDGLCAELPLLRSLLDGRLVLDRLREGAITAEQARGELERLWSGSPFAREVLGLIGSPGGASPAPSAPAPSSDDSSSSSIFDLIDMGGSSSAPAASSVEAPRPAASVAAPAISKFSSLIANVARSGRTGAGPVQPAQAIAHVERALGTQIGAILQHPEVRRLERAYRGLSFLIERAGSHSSVRFDVLSRPPSEAAEALAALASGTSEAPVSFAIVDLDIDGSAAAFNRLTDLAQVAEDHTLPVLVNGAPRLLGLDDLHGVEKLDNKAALFQAPHQAPWRSAAAKPSLRWVSIAMNGQLGRLPYDKGTSRVREAVIRELPAEDGKVWLSPVWALATLAVTSFRETGWPCRIVGPRAGVLGDLPVYQREEDDAAIATEAFVTTDSQKQLAKSGVLFLAAAQNSDAIYVLTAPTAYVTPEKRTYDSDSTEPELRLDRVQLGDQLFVARLVQFLRALASKLPAQTPPSEAQAFFEGSIHALFEDAPPSGPELIVRATGDSHGTSVALTLRPRRFLGVVLEELSLEIPLG